MKAESLMPTNLVVCIGVVCDSKDGNDVVFAQHTDQCGYWRVILVYILCVTACVVQVTLLVIAWQDAWQYVSTVSLVVKGWLSGENQEMCAVLAPADLILE